MTPISICIIAKNEEKHMDNFLSSIQKHMGSYPYEIVLVDTGSTDATVELAHKYTDKIFFFDWIGDFSAARNYSIQCASNDWILVLDCDEYIYEATPALLDIMVQKHPRHIGMITIRNHYKTGQINGIHTVLMERFFNRNFFHYESAIHEQLKPLNPEHTQERFNISLTVEHYGYTGTSEELAAKANRNNELLLKMLEETPDDAYLYFQLGQSYSMINDAEKACYYYGCGLDYATNPKLEYVQLMVVGYGYALIDLEQYEDALMLINLYDDFGHIADFVCLIGIIYLRNGMINEALQEFQQATTIKKAHVEGANSFIPNFNMGCIHEVLGNSDTAIESYKRCGSFPAALERLRTLGIS